MRHLSLESLVAFQEIDVYFDNFIGNTRARGKLFRSSPIKREKLKIFNQSIETHSQNIYPLHLKVNHCLHVTWIMLYFNKSIILHIDNF